MDETAKPVASIQQLRGDHRMLSSSSLPSWLLSEIIPVTAGASIVVLVVGPFAYASGGWASFMWSIFCGVTMGLITSAAIIAARFEARADKAAQDEDLAEMVRRGWVHGPLPLAVAVVAPGVPIGLYIALSRGTQGSIDVAVAALFVVFMVSAAGPIAVGEGPGTSWRRQTWDGYCIGLFFVGAQQSGLLPYGDEHGLVNAVRDLFTISAVRKMLLVPILALPCSVALPVAVRVGLLLHPSIRGFLELWPYFRAMSIFVGTFSVGYVSLAWLFATFYFASWRIDPTGAFRGLSASPNFGEFFYFSMITIGTLGYGDVTPVSTLARFIVCGELVVQIAWVTVVFAAVVAHLQPRLALIASSAQSKAHDASD